MDNVRIDDPEYLQGQIDALFQLVMALASFAPRPAFRAHAIGCLNDMRDLLIPETTSESRIAAVEQAIRMFENVFPPDDTERPAH